MMVRRQSSRRMNTAGFLIFMLIGTIFVIIGAFFLSSRLNLVRNGLTAEGTVISLEEHRSTDDGKTSVTYRPEIEFKTSSGEMFTVLYSTGSNPPAYDVGEKVKIIYAQDNPRKIVIDSKFEIYFFPLIFIFMGGLVVVIGLGGIVRRVVRGA